MREISANYLDRLIDQQIVGTNHEVYDERLLSNTPKFDKSPHCIYFYYIKFHDHGCPEVYHYFYDHGDQHYIEHDEVPGHIKRLAENARIGGSDPPSNGGNFENIEWHRKSYIAIFMDSPCWKLWKRYGNPQRCGIIFNLLKGSTPNHSFFDADDLMVDMAGAGDPSEMRSSVYFVNHMKKNARGDDLRYEEDGVTPDKQYFSFDIYFDVADRSNTSSTVFVIDPDGTNVGPPLPPP